MYHYILESPEVIQRIIKNSKRILKEPVEYFEMHNIEQIYMLGSGTSYHAALAAKHMMEKVLKMKVFVSYPLMFIDEPIFNKNTLVIGCSHAGQSRSTINGLDKARKEGLLTIASSAIHDSELLKHADVTLYCEIGEEDAGPKTKGYICAIVTYILFALELAFKKD